ncbi:related to integral membrane protein [Cephalotrichum gorgonifer]|uniref:Related to integral membrane protein n=1 Tax=Cephalotrichum gorgonifer TaxID=2041049 RepID=A0AAE8MW40_9PEZI|nr:related to integral membrane protein [Cephalotrichum gorgonifer]
MAAPGGLPPLPSNPDEDESGIILGATLTVTSLATLSVLTRLYVRGLVVCNIGWDDAIMAFAMAISLAGQAVVIASTFFGAGKHIGDIDGGDLITGMKLNFISQPIYLIGICVVKLAVGASLLRIANTKFYKRTIIGIMVFMSFYTIGCFFTVMFQCTDIRILWDSSISAVCWPQKTLQSLSYTNASLNILTDLLFAIIIPIPILWNLNMHIRTRISLIAILGLGVFVCAAACVKVSYVSNYGKLGDWLWDSRNITIWTVVEMNTGIVAGSLPCLRPLFKRFFASVYGKGSRKTSGAAAYYGHGSRKSGNNWRALSSGRPQGQTDALDDASSQEGINGLGRREEFELGDGNRNSRLAFGNSAVVTGIEANGSQESLNGMRTPQDHQGPKGITKTTVTTVDVHEARRY